MIIISWIAAMIAAIVAVIILIITTIAGSAKHLNVSPQDITTTPMTTRQLTIGGTYHRPLAHRTAFGTVSDILGDLRPVIVQIVAQPTPLITRECDIPSSVPYRSLEIARRALHVGQLKLFLSEVQFLTEFAPNTAGFVIYAGSGPGHTRQMLANMFPRLKFILIDPQEHNIMGSSPADRLYFRTSSTTEFPHLDIKVATPEGIKTMQKGAQLRAQDKLAPVDIARTILSEPKFTFYMIEDLYTDDLSQAFKQISASGHAVFFISDIRTNSKFMLGGAAPNASEDALDAIAQSLGICPTSRDGSGAIARGMREIAGGASADADDESDHPNDLDILANNAWQHTWVHILQPTACMLKFRTPFMNDYDIRMVAEHAAHDNVYSATFKAYKEHFGVDLIAEYKSKRYVFLAPDCLNLQAFPGPTSTEVRLIATRDNTEKYMAMRAYDTKGHEDRLFYYNMMREYGFTDINKRFFDVVPGLDGCADCTLTLAILTQYVDRVGSACGTPVKILGDVLRMVHRTIKMRMHGFAFAPYKSVEDAANALVSRTTAQRVENFSMAQRQPAHGTRGRGRGRGRRQKI